jgi:hypothetical protein
LCTLAAAEFDHVHADWNTLSKFCFRANVDKYTYSVCPFKNVTQKDIGTVHVVMGVWKVRGALNARGSAVLVLFEI